MYLPAFETLKGCLALAEGQVTMPVEAFRALIRLAAHGAGFDEAFYLRTYGDVADAVGAQTVASGLAHFVDGGFADGRLPHRFDVDEDWYVARYPDVAAGIADGSLVSGAEHFNGSGYREGRVPAPALEAEIDGWAALIARHRDQPRPPAVPELAPAAAETPATDVTKPTGRKRIPDEVRVEFPLTRRFLSKLTWLDRERPEVSIVILSYCRPDLVENLVRSILLFTAGHRYEIIVVDNGSPTGEHTLSRTIDRLVSVIHLRHNRYLGDAYNIGVEQARGEFVVLMNNDIVVEADWLQPLVAPLQTDPMIGAVGPKFLYPTGQLQEAGSMIDPDGTSVQRGKRSAANTTAFDEVAEVDYCTGATIATRRDLFLDTLGYDWRWSPGYYEDVDFCFKLRDRGLRTIYAPDSSVFHIESATMAERPPSANMTAAVIDNRAKFIAKWAGLLARHQEGAPRVTGPDGTNLDRVRQATAAAKPGLKRIGLFIPYEYIPGGGEKFALSIIEQFADEADLTLVFEDRQSLLRVLSVNDALGFPDLRLRLVTLDQAKRGTPFDIFILIGNELFPVRAPLGQRNYFICQFPFPVSHEFLAHYDTLGYHAQYDSYIVYSDYVAAHVADQLHGWGVTRPIAVLPPTADAIGPGPSSEEAEKTDDIIGVGRFFTGGHNKRHDIMLQVMRGVAGVSPGSTLHLAGAVHNGAEHRLHLQGLRDLAEGLPVQFHVDIERSALEALYRRCKVYLHAGGWDVNIKFQPEAVEHFGITILEAMSAGCVPIAYAAGGPTEIIQHGVNGILVLGVSDMTEWTLRLLRDWNTPRIRAMRKAAMRTAASYGKDVFRTRVRDVVSFAPASPLTALL